MTKIYFIQSFYVRIVLLYINLFLYVVTTLVECDKLMNDVKKQLLVTQILEEFLTVLLLLSQKQVFQSITV